MIQSQAPPSAASAAAGGKTASPCDGCLRRRARWYCAADDAFLCQSCDSAIHSANPLARRHERLRLKPASPASSPLSPAAKHAEASSTAPPVWLTGFTTRKARTRRPSHHAKPAGAPALGHVPEVRTPVPDLTEISADEDLDEEEEEEEEKEQLLYRVPVFDPFLAEFCSPGPVIITAPAGPNASGEGVKPVGIANSASADGLTTVGFVPSDMELAEFAADMETLLRQGLDGGDHDSFSMESLGLLDVVRKGGDIDDGNTTGCAAVETSGEVKLEEQDDDNHLDLEVGLDMSGPETLDIDFDCGSPLTSGEDGTSAAATGDRKACKLRLDYEAILAVWSTSPWTGGERPPQLSLDVDGRSDFMGLWGGGGGGGGEGRGQMNRSGENGGMGGGIRGGREARVTRYREKRRTRLFSKKIRYEVRKLNAEKRPRMKGRFVKRASFATT